MAFLSCRRTLQHTATRYSPHSTTLQHGIQTLSRMAFLSRGRLSVNERSARRERRIRKVSIFFFGSLSVSRTRPVQSCICVAVCCSVLQRVAVCCSVLQCVAVCIPVCCSVYCSMLLCVLQCVAECCSILQSVAMCSRMLQCIAVCCSVLQCVAVCCSVLQCVAVCCSVLQYTAECCNV